MARLKRKIKKKKPGTPPGTLQFTGETGDQQTLVHIVEYNNEFCRSEPVSSKHQPTSSADHIRWYDVRGLQDVSRIESFGTAFQIHPLVLEDVLNIDQRPKFEEYPNGIFTVARTLTYTAVSGVQTEQISFYFGHNFLLSFQENIDDTFAGIRERLEKGRGRIRSSGSDYLAYALIDNVLDNYFHVLEKLEEEMELLEEQIFKSPVNLQKARIHDLKFQLLFLRKSVMPLREAIGAFSRSSTPMVHPDTGVFLRDLHDHAIRISDLVETYRDMMNSLQELYISELSMRMNKVMQLLTIITTIFVPLTFLAGVYGMNFKHIPELEWRYGYPLIISVMASIAIILLIIFRRKKWL